MSIDVALALLAALAVLAGLTVAAAAETALERASDARLRAMANRGDAAAIRLVGTRSEPAQFLGPLTTARVIGSGAVTTLGAFAGWRIVEGAAGLAVGGALAIVVVTVVQLAIGPAAARHPESMALRMSMAAHIISRAFMAPAYVLSAPGFVVRKFWPLQGEAPDEDILAVIEREEAGGGFEEPEQRMIRGVIKLADTSAHEIMVPRIDIAAADIEDGIDAIIPIVVERGFSRVPVYRDTIDNIEGIVFAKDVLRVLHSGNGNDGLHDLLRKPMVVPESKRLDDLLREMQGARTHLAVVVDEYGGTAGIVTIEDLLEEIVGEIEDEYDLNAAPVDWVSDDEAVLDAGLPASMLAELFGFVAESEDFDTVGGFVIHELGRLPAVGDSVTVDGLTLQVLSMAGRRIRRVRVARTDDPPRRELARVEASAK